MCMCLIVWGVWMCVWLSVCVFLSSLILTALTLYPQTVVLWMERYCVPVCTRGPAYLCWPLPIPYWSTAINPCWKGWGIFMSACQRWHAALGMNNMPAVQSLPLSQHHGSYIVCVCMCVNMHKILRWAAGNEFYIPDWHLTMSPASTGLCAPFSHSCAVCLLPVSLSHFLVFHVMPLLPTLVLLSAPISVNIWPQVLSHLFSLTTLLIFSKY